jgi:DNA invertase Pin-like site-specific DNA recombinase
VNELSRPTAAQLGRLAVVYIRQSSPGQVLNNVESRERQYELVERAVSLGWDRERVVIIDEDQGRRGSGSDNRGGFQRLVAEVGLAHVGLVLGIEVSRLARRNADWYNLMDLCALTDTLIADGDGVYHPADYNSRLVLGLKGTMAEAELHLLRQRLSAARLHKAAKGELRMLVPVGLDYDEQGMIVLARDEAVRTAIAEVFERFRSLTSGRQVLLSLRADELKLPRRKPGEVKVSWVDATYRAVREILVKPAYAGAFVFGRTRQQKSVDQTGRVTVSTRQVAREEWQVCIVGHHPGYIDWETYLENQQRLAANRRVPQGEGGGAPREGRALLQGLVVCGRCGRRMQVGYWGAARAARPVYACARAAYQTGSREVCQQIGGGRVDQVVLDAVFGALEPAGLLASASALAHAEAEHQQRLGAFQAALERARYEADRARRQFDSVEPENRLVARGLEAEWEARLAEVQRAERSLEEQRTRRPVSLTDEEAAWLARAGADLRAVFEADSTTMAERKQLLRTVLSEVTVTVDSDTKEARLQIWFEGGACVERALPAPRRGWHIPATDEDTVELVRRLASHYNDTEIARILSRQGRKTAKGLGFTRERVNALRQSRGIPAAPPHQPSSEDHDAQIMSLTRARRELGVSDATLYRWLRAGFIHGFQLTPGGPWNIRVDDQLRAKIVPDLPTGWVTLKEAAHILGVARQTVLDRTKRGELNAIHVNRGRRSGLAIEIPANQPQYGRLFDEQPAPTSGLSFGPDDLTPKRSRHQQPAKDPAIAKKQQDGSDQVTNAER